MNQCNQITSENLLTIYIEDKNDYYNHASIRLQCASCSNSSIYSSLMPGEEGDKVLGKVEKAILVVAFIPFAIVDIFYPFLQPENLPYEIEYENAPSGSYQSITFPISEEAANEIYNKIEYFTNHCDKDYRFHLLNNCIDFTQDLYNEAGLEGHFFDHFSFHYDYFSFYASAKSLLGAYHSDFYI
jgi:hypothetical protein